MLMSLFALCERRYHMDFEVKHLICAGLDVHKKTIVVAVCMESTGKYWIPVFNILETHMHVVLTHPKYVKAIKGKKRINVTQNGLRIFSILILLRHLLFHRLISGHSVSFPDTVSSFPICVPLKKTLPEQYDDFPYPY